MSDSNCTEFRLAHKNTGWVEIDTDVIDWVDVIADCYGLTTEEVAEQFLRHGAKNHESILGWDY